MIVRQQIECHCGYLCEQLIERGRIRGCGDVVTMSAPGGGLVIPGGGNRDDYRFGHMASMSVAAERRASSAAWRLQKRPHRLALRCTAWDRSHFGPEAAHLRLVDK